MYFKKLWDKIKNFLPFVLVGSVLGLMFSIMFMNDCRTYHFRQEMTQMCQPDHFAGFKRAATGLYQVSCMSKTGQVRDVYIERDVVISP